MARRVKGGRDAAPAPVVPDASGLDAPEPPLGLRGQARATPPPVEDAPTPLAPDLAAAEPTVTLDAPGGDTTETVPASPLPELTSAEAASRELDEWLGAVDPLSAPDLTLRRVVPVRRDWKSSLRQDTPTRFTSLWSAADRGAVDPASAEAEPDGRTDEVPAGQAPADEAPAAEDDAYDPPSDPLSGLRPLPPALPPLPKARGADDEPALPTPPPPDTPAATEAPAATDGPASTDGPAAETAPGAGAAPESPDAAPDGEHTPGPVAGPPPEQASEAPDKPTLAPPAEPAPPVRPPARDRETAPDPGPGDRATLPSPPPMAAPRSSDRWAERPPLLLAAVAGVVVLALGVAIGAAVHALMSSRQAQPDLPPVEPYRPAAVAPAPTPVAAPPAAPAGEAAPPAEAAPGDAPPEEAAAPATTGAATPTGTKRPKAAPTEKLDEVAEPAEENPWGAGEATPAEEDAAAKKRGGKRKPKDDAAAP